MCFVGRDNVLAALATSLCTGRQARPIMQPITSRTRDKVVIGYVAFGGAGVNVNLLRAYLNDDAYMMMLIR